MTSTEIPSASSAEAAASARGTIAASATTVASVPSRTTFASPSGVTSSPSGTSALSAKSALCSHTITGSGSRIADAMRPTMSDGVDGATTFRPGTAIAQFSIDWLCWAPNRSPPPFAVRMTSGSATWPSVM